jgi:hypothetical protein
MTKSASRWVGLLAALGITFAASVAIGLKVLPGPHSETDYLVVGSIATLLALGVLFAFLINAWVRTPDVFFRRRRKTGQTPPGQE